MSTDNLSAKAQSGGEEMKTPGEEFIRWAMQHCRMKEVYDQFEFANDATGFNTFYQPIVNKINKIFKDRSTHPTVVEGGLKPTSNCGCTDGEQCDGACYPQFDSIHIERAYCVGYINGASANGSAIDGMADGKLKDAYIRFVKSDLVPGIISRSLTTEDLVTPTEPSTGMRWEKKESPKRPGKYYCGVKVDGEFEKHIIDWDGSSWGPVEEYDCYEDLEIIEWLDESHEPPTPVLPEVKEGEVPSQILDWIEAQDRDYPGSGHAIGWKKGAVAMYRKMQEEMDQVIENAYVFNRLSVHQANELVTANARINELESSDHSAYIEDLRKQRDEFGARIQELEAQLNDYRQALNEYSHT
jgi:hypothetical protein